MPNEPGTTMETSHDHGAFAATPAPDYGLSKRGRPRTRPPRLGPHSRLLARGTLSGRTREGRYTRAVEAALAQHVAPGGEPTITQRLLIRRAALALLRLELLDAKPTLTEHDLRLAASLDNRARLILRELGLKAAPMPTLTLADHLAKLTAKRAAP
jgi:hypothetical protein